MVSAVHVFTLCTLSHFASTSPVVEHSAQVKNLQHIQQAASRLLLLYFALQKGDMRSHRQGLFEKGASESITSANDKLDGPLPPQNSELLEPTVVYTKLPYLTEGRIYQTAVSRPEIYRTAVSRPKLPPVRIERVVPKGNSLGLPNRHDGQASRDTMLNSGEGSLWQN